MKEVVSKIKKATTGLANSNKQIIIIGGNEVSVQLAEPLIKTGQNIVVIEEDDYYLKQIQERVDVLALKGRGTDISLLKEVATDKTNLLIAITNNDYENLLTGIYGKSLGIPNVVVQVKEIRNLDYKIQHQDFKLDLVVNPFAKVIKRIKGVIRPGMELEIDNFMDKRVQISKFNISHQSSFAYNNLDNLKLPEDSLILAILRKGRVIIPKGRDKIYPGDTVFIICQKGFRGKLTQLVNYHSTDKEKIVLVGGGEINYQLAEYFSKNSVVTIIEEDRRRCEELAENLVDILVLEGKGTDIDLLKEEGVAKSDAFIAAGESDEANMLMANLAKKLGVKNSIAVVKDINYTYLTDLSDIDHIISPSASVVDTILDYFYQGQVGNNTIFEGQVNVSEVRVKKSSKLANLELPSDLIVALIKRDKNVIIPKGESRLQRGDRLVVLSLAVKGDITGYFN
ncbi:potassium transporter [Orenia metallireducens]|uniref:Trk system potassium uptake protein TrkA n=1 Tax=Orenia metallireducens TaxID=1413210 RepID=A0A1C0AAM2_9FIRM|nr:Trk system potassium transporter TrkA [Orenia metallireducens]OCL27326.1 potassium transporter [Orenia metallireducens]